MTLTATTDWELRSGATAGMLNGGGFNQAATFGITDGTTDANTANTASPVLSSATYTFVASDALAWVFVAAGTNWTKGFYQIASVAGGKATLSAAIGAAIQLGTSGKYDTASTVVGCATVGTPTAGTIGVDYSQQNAADYTATDFVSVGSSTTLTSATAGFKRTHIGNIFHLTTTGTGAFGVVGWYEITAYTSTSQVTTDRTTNSGTALASGTGYVGGSLDLTGALADSFFESVIGGNQIWVKNDAGYSLGSGVAVASASGTGTANILMRGFNTLRGDRPTGANRPAIAFGANTFAAGANWQFRNIIITGTGGNSFATSTDNMIVNCKITNPSSTAARNSAIAASGTTVINSEFVSQMGPALAISSATGARVVGSYCHDSDLGISCVGGPSTACTILFNLIEDCKTAGITVATATTLRHTIASNTIYGSEAKFGIGIRFTAATSLAPTILNNILYGLTTGISVATAQQDSVFENFNDFFNNTTDRTLCLVGQDSLAVNPAFTNALQITGTTATTSGSVLTQSGADFTAVTDNVDYCQIISGTGKTVGSYLITSHTTTTLTFNNAPGTNATADGVFSVGVGHDFSIGVALKGAGFPGAFPGSESTGYLDVGAVQRRENTERSLTFAG